MENDQVKQFLTSFQTKNEQSFNIPVEGSLGLLAMGDIGLMAWRLKMKEKLSINTKNKVLQKNKVLPKNYGEHKP